MSTEARRDLQEKERAARAEKRCRVAACGAAGCLSNGGLAVRAALDKTIKEAGADDVEVIGTGCLGLCDAGPLVQVADEKGTRLYEKVDAQKAARIAAEDAAKKAMEVGMRSVTVLVRGPGGGRESAIRGLAAAGLRVSYIRDVTPVPHNGCRPPKRRRV